MGRKGWWLSLDYVSYRLLSLLIWSTTDKKQNPLYYLKKKLSNSFEYHTEAISEIIKDMIKYFSKKESSDEQIKKNTFCITRLTLRNHLTYSEDIIQIHFNCKENILDKIYIAFDLEIYSQLLPTQLVRVSLLFLTSYKK